uniref:Uncharacterized protein n=1 Tax=Anguilla anguilla TaxID=7936 RepID=A0A0E9P8S9_ANGAN
MTEFVLIYLNLRCVVRCFFNARNA